MVYRGIGCPKLDQSASGRCEPAVQASAVVADIHNRDHDCEPVAVEGDRPGPILTTCAGADEQILLEARYLDVDVFERDCKLNTLVELGRRRIGKHVGIAELAEDRAIDVVRPLPRVLSAIGIRSAGGSVAVAGHHVLQAGSAVSRARSLLKQRPRVGPMLPRGIPRAAATSS